MDSEERELDEAQDNQEEGGEAKSNPKTSGQLKTCVTRLPKQQTESEIQKKLHGLILNT